MLSKSCSVATRIIGFNGKVTSSASTSNAPSLTAPISTPRFDSTTTLSPQQSVIFELGHNIRVSQPFEIVRL